MSSRFLLVGFALLLGGAADGGVQTDGGAPGIPDGGAPSALVEAAAPAPPQTEVRVPNEPGVWAGHQVVVGQRTVPVLGTFKTRTETYFLALISREDDAWVVRQQACAVRIAKVAGVTLTFPESTAQRLPVVPFTLLESPDGWFYAQPWEAAWNDEDLDEDGEPGVSIQARSFFCNGKLHVANHSVNRARARLFDDLWVGEIRIKNRQTTLGTTSRCLRLTGKEEIDEVHGTFVYAPVKTGLTCADLLALPEWPTRAPDPD